MNGDQKVMRNELNFNDLSPKQESNLSGGGGIHTSDSFRWDKYINVRQDIYSNINSNVKLKVNVAKAEGDSVALGKNSLTEVTVLTYTDDYSSRSTAVGFSAND